MSRTHWPQLAALIRTHIDDASLECHLRYQEDYPHSVNTRLADDASIQWARTDLLHMAEQLEDGIVDDGEYMRLRGDMVLQREKLAYPIEAFVEEALYEARVTADLVWETNFGNQRQLDELLDALEEFTQERICANLEAFERQVGKPRAIRDTWELGRRWLDRRSQAQPTRNPPRSAETLPDETPEASWSHDLTPREADVARLVATGLSNKMVATRLGLQETTVRNTLSRVFAKLEIASRAELIVLATHGE